MFGTSPAASVSYLADFSERLQERAQQVVSEHPRFSVGSCVNSEDISCCLAEIMCRSRNDIGTVCDRVSISK